MGLGVQLLRKYHITYDEGKTLIECREDVFDKNITYNLMSMAKEAGLYDVLSYPEKINCFLAKDIIEILKLGISKLKNDPEFFRKFNPVNGWGSYEGFIEFLESYLEKCEEYPESEISLCK